MTRRNSPDTPPPTADLSLHWDSPLIETVGHVSNREIGLLIRGLCWVKPVVRGGSDDPTNLQVLCRSCNSAKGARI